jgi:hypothetical protein
MEVCQRCRRAPPRADSIYCVGCHAVVEAEFTRVGDDLADEFAAKDKAMKATIALSDTVRVMLHEDGSLDLEISMGGTSHRLTTGARLTPAEVERLRVLLMETKPGEEPAS